MSGLVFRVDPRTITKKRSDRLKQEVDQEERFEKVAYGHVQNERVGFTKVGNRLKRAVTRYLTVGEGKLHYYKNISGGKPLGFYVFGPGTRVTLLNMNDEDLSEEIIESGMQCLRIVGLKKSNGDQRSALFILFDTKDEAVMWQRGIRYSKKAGIRRESGENDDGDDGEEAELDDEFSNGRDGADGSSSVDNGGKVAEANKDGSGERNDGEATGRSDREKETKALQDEGQARVAVPSDDESDNEGPIPIGEPGDTPIAGSSQTSTVDRDGLLRNQRVVLQTARHLQTKADLPSTLFQQKANKIDVEKLMNRFAFSRNVTLESYDVHIVASTMMKALEDIGSTVIPMEVYGMYESSFSAIKETGVKRISKDVRIIKDLIVMMSASNVRLVREVTAVVRLFCLRYRPWELGIRPARRFDDTRRNLAPKFARILVHNDHGENSEKSPSIASIVLLRMVLQHHNVIFGYKDKDDIKETDSKEVAVKDHGKSLENDQEENDEAGDVTTGKLEEGMEEDMGEVVMERGDNAKSNGGDSTAAAEGNEPSDVESPHDDSQGSEDNDANEQKDERTRKLEAVIKKYEDKIAKYKLEVDDKYMLQDWYERVENSRSLLKQYLKDKKEREKKEREEADMKAALAAAEERKRRVAEALSAAKMLEKDMNGLNLVEVRRTLRDVKHLWIQARATSLGAMNGSVGDGELKMGVGSLIKKSDEVLDSVQEKVSIVRNRVIKLADTRVGPSVQAISKQQEVEGTAKSPGRAGASPTSSRLNHLKGWLSWGMGKYTPEFLSPDGMGSGNTGAIDEHIDGPMITSDVCRTLVEILNENVRLRSQLNAYTEAILLPTLEKEAEFQQNYDE